MKKVIDYSLYLVTDQKLSGDKTLYQAVEQAILGGCTVIQLREKAASVADFYRQALKLRELTNRYNIPLIINDRIDIALAVNADGVHIGQDDLPAAVVRKAIGDQMILGVSVATKEQALQAKQAGADYLGVGAIFLTETKKDAKAVSIAQLTAISQTVKLPVVAIGGINQDNLKKLQATGISGIAAVSAIIAQKNIQQAASDLKKKFLKLKT